MNSRTSRTNKSEPRTQRAKHTNPPPIATTVEVGMFTPLSVGLGALDWVGVGDSVDEVEADMAGQVSKCEVEGGGPPPCDFR